MNGANYLEQDIASGKHRKAQQSLNQNMRNQLMWLRVDSEFKIIDNDGYPPSFWKMMFTIAILAAGCFAYQWLLRDVPDYHVATERAYFQAIAVLFCWFGWKL